MKYNNETLINYCNEQNIKLINDYSNEKITRENYIEGKCLTNNCGELFNKTFRQIVKTGAYCKMCIDEISKNKIRNALVKWDINELNKFCCNNDIILIKDYSDVFINRNTIIEGFCKKDNCNNIFKKTFREILKLNGFCALCSKENGKSKIKATNLKKYGVEVPLQSPEIREKCKQTTMIRYGVEHNSQSQKIKQQKINKSLEKYGVEYVLQSPIIREKGKITNLKKYGVENPQQNKEIRDKTYKTNEIKYGVKHYLQTEEFRDKVTETCLEKYGVPHHSQNAEVAENMLNSAYKRKTYTLPSGKMIFIQGYENYMLDYLLFVDKITEHDIVMKRSTVPEIWYQDKNGKKRRHYVDFYIKSQNKCIEVKSTWTKQSKNSVFEKQKAAKDLGYGYEIWIFDRNGDILEKHI